LTTGGSVFGVSPTDSRKMRVERSCMIPACALGAPMSRVRNLKLAHYQNPRIALNFSYSRPRGLCVKQKSPPRQCRAGQGKEAVDATG
jgi:hypothetical protein